MNHTLRLAAGLTLSLILLGSSASAAVAARPDVALSPSGDDNAVYVLVGQAAVDLQRLSGNADGNQPE